MSVVKTIFLSDQRNDDTGKFDQFRQFEKQVADQQSYIDQLLAAYDQLNLAHGQLQSERLGQQQQISRLQAKVNDLETEQKQQVEGFEELTTLQQQQLEVQRKEIQQLSGQLRSLKLQPREEGPQGSRQRDVSVASPKLPKSRKKRYCAD